MYKFPLSLLSYSKIRTNVSPFIYINGPPGLMGQGEDADVSSVGSEIDKDRDVSSGILSVFP